MNTGSIQLIVIILLFSIKGTKYNVEISLVDTIQRSKYEPMETATISPHFLLLEQQPSQQDSEPAAVDLVGRMSMQTSEEAYNREETTAIFSSQVISFALFGTVSRLTCLQDTSVLFRNSISQVSKQFPDIPDIFMFAPSNVLFHTVGVFCRQSLNQGAVLGPFTGRRLSPEEVIQLKLKSCWEIHQNGKIQYCLDGSDPHYRNWMYFIQYARNQKEQNLMAIQHEDKIFFRAMREILLGEELLVWYDKYQYDLYMGIPQGFKDEITNDFDDDPLSEEEVIEVTETDEEEEQEEKGSPQPQDLFSSDTEQTHATLFPTGQLPITTPFTVYPIPNLQWLKHSRPAPPPLPPPMIGSPLLTIPSHTWPPLSPPQIHNMGKPSSLDMFERWADGTRWRCQICQRIFTSQGSLRAHARIHTGEKPYQCQFCKRVFTQASTLRSHERLHTGEKPYKCDHCGKAFTQSAGLRSHLKTHITH